MLDKSIREFTELAASKLPVPGGGGVSALAGSLAAALAEMVTNLTTGKKRYAEYEDEIQQIMKETDDLRIELLEGINKDAEAFAPLDPDYEETMERCLRTAAGAPFEILKQCCRVVELDERLAVIGSRLAVSDAATSAMLAHGAIYGAAINVKVNTRLMKDRQYADDLDRETAGLTEEYGERALACYRAIEKRLTNG